MQDQTHMEESFCWVKEEKDEEEEQEEEEVEGRIEQKQERYIIHANTAAIPKMQNKN